MHPAASVQSPVLQVHWGNHMCTVSEPGILHVRQPGWRDFEIALVLQVLSSPKGQLRVTGLVDTSRYVI